MQQTFAAQIGGKGAQPAHKTLILHTLDRAAD
jgi:hypothetical protein